MLIGVVVFFGNYLRNLDYSGLRDLRFSPVPLLASAACALGFRYWGILVWRGILKDLGSHQLPSFSVLALIYAKSWMARYIPGAVAWIAGRVVLAMDLGISKSRLAVASLVEAAVQVIAIAATSIILLSFDNRISEVISNEVRVIVLIVVSSLLLILIPAVFNRLIRSAYYLFRRQEAYEQLSTNGRAIIRSFAMYVAGSFISGLSYYFLAVAIWEETAVGDIIFIVGAVNLAAVIGMATPFVPAGLGVRDASLLILLAVIFPGEIALAITILSRLWTAINDVAFLTLTNLVQKFE